MSATRKSGSTSRNGPPKATSVQWLPYIGAILSFFTFMYGPGMLYKLENFLSTLAIQPRFSANVFNAILSFVQVLGLFFLLSIRYLWFSASQEGNKRASLSQVKHQQYKMIQAFTLILWTWVPLYIWLSLAFSGTLPGVLGVHQFVMATADVFSGLNAYFFLYAFLVWNQPVKATTTLHLINFRKNHKLILVLSLLVILCSVTGRMGWSLTLHAGPWMLAFWNAIAMVYLFSKLSDDIRERHFLIMIPLYLYAFLQLWWTTFAEPNAVARYLLGISLLLKLYMSVLVFLVAKTKNLQNYIDKKRSR